MKIAGKDYAWWQVVIFGLTMPAGCVIVAAAVLMPKTTLRILRRAGVQVEAEV